MSPFGGSGNIGPLPLPLNVRGRDMRLRLASRVLGDSGAVRIDPRSTGLASDLSSVGLQTVWTVVWSGSWDSARKAELTAELEAMRRAASSGRASFRAILVGNEIEANMESTGEAGALAEQYLADLSWYCDASSSVLPGIMIYGPGIGSANISGNSHDRNGQALLDAVLSRGYGGAPVRGPSFNTYWWNVHAEDHPWRVLVEKAVAADLGGFLCAEFGVPVGWFRSGQQILCVPEETQALVGISSVIQAIALGADLVCWSHFPMDTRWSTTDQLSLHNRTGMFTGGEAEGESMLSAGSPRLISFLYRFVIDLWRRGGISSGEIVQDSGADALMIFRGSTSDLAFVIQREEAPKRGAVPYELQIPETGAELVNISTLQISPLAGPVVSLTSSVIPQCVRVPSGGFDNVREVVG